MEKEAFEKSLRAFTRRPQFHPFFIELTSGNQLSIDHPEALVFRGGVAVHISQDGFPTLFDHQSVARLIGTVDVVSSS